MLPSRTLSLYVLREVTQYAILGFLVFALILVSNNVVRHLELLVAAHFSPSDTVAVVGCLFAMFAPPAVPMALLFGILLGVGRLSADSEVTAMRAIGLGLPAILIPVLALAALVSLASAYLLVRVEPAARRELRSATVSIAARSAFLEPGKFRSIGNRVLFVREADRDNRLQGVVISDRSDPEKPLLIFAESGELSFDPDTAELRLLLEAGEIHLEPSDGDESYRRWSFDTFDYAFDMSSVLARKTSRIDPKEMTLAELRSALARIEAGESIEDLKKKVPVAYALQIHRRFALPVAPLVFALLGVPLGLRGGRGARSTGALLCVALLFTYYALLSFGQELALEGAIPPALGLWVPNLVFALAAVPLLRRAASGFG